MKNKTFKIVSALIGIFAYIAITVTISDTIFRKYNVGIVFQSITIGIIAGIIIFIYLRVSRHSGK
jgi:H+/Cl- antiporter ClcA